MPNDEKLSERMQSDALEDVFAKYSNDFRVFLNERGGEWQMAAGLADLLTVALNEAWDLGRSEALFPVEDA